MNIIIQQLEAERGFWSFPDLVSKIGKPAYLDENFNLILQPDVIYSTEEKEALEWASSMEKGMARG